MLDKTISTIVREHERQDDGEKKTTPETNRHLPNIINTAKTIYIVHCTNLDV